jgi:hypothetical protein
MASLSQKSPKVPSIAPWASGQNHIWAIITLFVWAIGTGLYYYHFSFDTFAKAFEKYGIFSLQYFFDFFAKWAHNPAIGKLWNSIDAYGYFWWLIITPVIVFGIVQLLLRKKSFALWILSYLSLFIWTLWIVCIFTTLRYGYTLADTGVITFNAAPLQWSQLWELLSIGTGLTFSVLWYLALPTLILILSLGLGARVLALAGLATRFIGSMRLATASVIGFVILMTLIGMSGFVGLFNVWVFYAILLGILASSYEALWNELQKLWNEPRTTDISTAPKWLGYILNGGFLTLIATLVSINCVNIVRPFPIGWDDLGVYMNFPKILAYSESTLHQGMVLWQSFVGVGFLHGSATQAFFLNGLGGILALATVYAGITYFLDRLTTRESAESSGTFGLHLPLFAVATYASMPMVIFQLAKDMKLDSGLLAISIVALVCLFEGMRTEDAWHSKNILQRILFLISGILMGVAFTIKATALMLMIGGLAALWYGVARIRWLAVFLALFVSSFTALGLWKFLNVGIPTLGEPGVLLFCAMLLLASIVLVGSFWYSQEARKMASIIWRHLSISTALLLAGIAIGMSPWLVKNSIEVGFSSTATIGIPTLLSWDTKVLNPDYSRIMTPEAKTAIDRVVASNAIGKDGKTTNEDLGRYFGYESGINNYLKLPFNLTFQVNQGNDFTDIGPLYLSLFAGAFLYFLTTNIARAWAMILWVGIGLAYFVPSFRAGLTPLFSSIELPVGYGIITLLGLFPIILMSIDRAIAQYYKTPLPREPQRTEFIAFLCVYILLFALAAFGIVWYGILLYFGILCVITLGLRTLFGDERLLPRITSAVLVGAVFFPYFIGTVLVQAWNNLPADLPEYRQGQVSEYESIFLSRHEYVPLLAALNLTSTESLVKSVRSQAVNPELRALLEQYPSKTLSSLLELLSTVSRAGGKGSALAEQALAREAKMLRNSLYHGLLYPEKSSQNMEGIYRVGTFMSYYVNQNRARFYEDSLVTNFDTYLAGKDREATIDNLEKLGLRYILMDLNAATIDSDPRRDLTRRFEKLLDITRSNRLRLIATDSICLQLSLEFRSDPNSLLIAGVNYNTISRAPNGSVMVDDSWAMKGISAAAKKMQCASNIANLITKNQVNEQAYPFLIPYARAISARKLTDPKEIESFIVGTLERSYLAAFEILPKTVAPPLSPSKDLIKK